ncbi:flavin reductase family protein [candidate division KSB1 bacterium]|nr:flavin reductase family protein [candidate division KSB1 bacterium]NIR69639.1 flavin reductase family protein [candidate division KSB1 bacterium]NIS25746.1 flavin reductase family protein [candidate division KSB1 bacterium]NIT72615.1 flavin reductase family protein [candidate division KSB1 bacterium]NIU26427.1 flavin reductase family protein [candidate division KSB1 bacterium]
MPVNPETLRSAMSRFATGVTVVTLKSGDAIHGLTVNAFTSVSLEPPLVLICIQNEGVSYAHISETDFFVVNILSEHQAELAARFANPALSSEERFENVPRNVTESGVPILEGTLGHLECQIVNEFERGDHTIFLGEVKNAEVTEELRPLLFYDSQFYCL